MGPYVVVGSYRWCLSSSGSPSSSSRVIQLAPGGPEGSLLAAGRIIDPQVVEAYRHRLGVDQPLPVQYLRG